MGDQNENRESECRDLKITEIMWHIFWQIPQIKAVYETEEAEQNFGVYKVLYEEHFWMRWNLGANIFN